MVRMTLPVKRHLGSKLLSWLRVCRGDCGDPGGVLLELAHGGERGLALFAGGAEVGAHAAERFGAGHGAKAAGDLHADLEGSHVVLAAMVRAGNVQVVGVAQDFVEVGVEPAEQVDVLRASGLTASAAVMLGVGCPAGADQVAVATPVGGQQLIGQDVGPARGRRSWCG